MVHAFVSAIAFEARCDHELSSSVHNISASRRRSEMDQDDDKQQHEHLTAPIAANVRINSVGALDHHFNTGTTAHSRLKPDSASLLTLPSNWFLRCDSVHQPPRNLCFLNASYPRLRFTPRCCAFPVCHSPKHRIVERADTSAGPRQRFDGVFTERLAEPAFWLRKLEGSLNCHG